MDEASASRLLAADDPEALKWCFRELADAIAPESSRGAAQPERAAPTTVTDVDVEFLESIPAWRNVSQICV